MRSTNWGSRGLHRQIGATGTITFTSTASAYAHANAHATGLTGSFSKETIRSNGGRCCGRSEVWMLLVCTHGSGLAEARWRCRGSGGVAAPNSNASATVPTSTGTTVGTGIGRDRSDGAGTPGLASGTNDGASLIRSGDRMGGGQGIGNSGHGSSGGIFIAQSTRVAIFLRPWF